MSKISCVIHTFNSEVYLDKVLKCVAFCDEIVVVDMHSTDNTVDIAKTYNARVVFHDNIGFADPARQFGLAQCSYDWILAIDSDELVPQSLSKRLKLVADEQSADVVFISFRNFMFGREVIGSGWGYKEQVLPRFFRRGCLNYGDEVHNFIHIANGAKTKRIVSREDSIIHFNYDSISHFISKLDRYTNYETRKASSHVGPAIQILYHFFREMLGRFFILKGYKDGWLGLYLGLAMAFYRATVVAKMQLPGRSDCIRIYQAMDE